MFLTPRAFTAAMRCLVCWSCCLLFGLGEVCAEGLSTSMYGEMGLDAWAISPKRPAMATDGASATATHSYDALGLPDTDTEWHFKPVSPWLRFSGSAQLASDVEANFKFRADQVAGMHVDAANLDWAASPSFGFRAGVVNFSTNWCRTYDVDSPWVAEPDFFCRSNGYMNINNAAPGVQAYTNTSLGAYRVQTVVGLYRPLFMLYNSDEFGFHPPKQNFHIDFNRKIGAAVNVLNTQTATQVRLGTLRSDEGGAYAPGSEVDGHRTRQNLIDNYYFGFDTAVRPFLRFRYTWSQYRSHLISDELPVIQDKEYSQTVELIYDWQATDVLALGMSKFSIAAAQNDVSQNIRADDYYYQLSPAYFAAWRHQWGEAIYSTLQWTHATQTSGYNGARSSGSGSALGLRLGFQF